MCRYSVNQDLTVLNFIQCLNMQNSSHGIFYSEKLTESKCDVKYVNTVKLTT